MYPPGEAVPLGEVVIAYPQAQRQALERGLALDQELALLIVHGVLHLAGDDHRGATLEQAEDAGEGTSRIGGHETSNDNSGQDAVST